MTTSSMMHANHHLPLFTKLNKGYVVGRVLGEGGFAVVYAALREADNLSFAIKEYYPEALASRGLDGCTVQPKRKESDRLTVWQRRFEQEGEHLRRCQDYPPITGVVRFADLIKQHNTAYLAMERLHGNSLRVYLTEAKSAQWIIGWLKPLLDTLEQLHGRNIFHRDISPNNVFLTADNKPVLMDFGLAREGIRDSALKSSTVGAGTEGFIAPEQTMEATSNRVDARTDLYSLGGLVYMALMGELPPSAAHRAQGAQLRRCRNVSALTEQLEKLAFHCLELDRNKRPENVAMIKKQYALLPQPSISEKTIVPDFTLDESQAKKLSQNKEKQLQRQIEVDIEQLARKQRLLEQKELDAVRSIKNSVTEFKWILVSLVLVLVILIRFVVLAFNSENTAKVDTPPPVIVPVNKQVSLIANSCTGDCINGKGTIALTDGGKYVGDFKNGKANGQGTYTFANGAKYVGEFKNDTAEGQGAFTYTNGDKYVGEFKNDTMEGQGTETYANGGKYVGEFKNSKRDGQGTLTYANGGKYVGEFKNNKREGQGTETRADGDKYVGEWRNGKKEGQGTYTLANGTVKSGFWKNDEFVQ